jgi:hypothetical protein
MTSGLVRDPVSLRAVGRRVEETVDTWMCATARAIDALPLRSSLRAYLNAGAGRAIDTDAALTLYRELVANCIHHAPGPLSVELRWREAALIVVDAIDRLRLWPFSADDLSAARTHEGFVTVRALAQALRVTRDPSGGTRVRVTLRPRS